MNRIVGLETEYGCLVSGDDRQGGPDAFPIRVKNHLFKIARIGAIDLHYRDYEEPPGNGGFLLNGGRLYLDMGHIEYSTPECLSLRDIVAFDRAGDYLLQHALESMGIADRVSFLKNNIDHHTGATFGCHENYLMKRGAQFTPQVLSALLSFLATRQIFTGAGRVGQANPLAFEFDQHRADQPIYFQISQRADHIVNDIYQWVQFNRAIINARDEPLADYRKYRRLHLLIGDSNMSEYANALKAGTTSLVLDLLEEGIVPKRVGLMDAVQSTREISRDAHYRWLVRLENGQTRTALEIQHSFLALAKHYLAGQDEENDWVIREWESVLDGLEHDPMSQVGKIDWVAKKWLLQMFMEQEGIGWDDPWLQSLDLEYHNLDPKRGLYFALGHEGRLQHLVSPERVAFCAANPPSNTRAAARGVAVRFLREQSTNYIINWDSIGVEDKDPLNMQNPFHTYRSEVSQLLSDERPERGIISPP
ncbi:MAG TPA: proteasome accessory factor PafA2 family protein [Verrucomicrobiae bacterium]|nr:proteasome accessory factor PafA2 family protein [Verrucomicrobiae bacterium]